MRITVLALGTRGDVQPYVALGLGLEAHGHDVRIACLAQYQGLVTGAGLACVPLAGDPGAIFATGQGPAWAVGHRGPVRLVRGIAAVGEVAWEKLLSEVAGVCEDTDLLVFGPIGFIGLHLAAQRGIAACLAQLQPLEPTGAFPSAFAPARRSLGRVGNQLTHRLLLEAGWRMIRPAVNRCCRELALDPMARRSPLRDIRASGMPVLYGFSPAIVPKPRDWPASVHVTGYWFLDTGAWTPPADLAAFLDAGPPPVYVGFGSMVPGDPARTWATVREAVRRAGVRAVLRHAPPELAEEGSILVLDDIPHDWLFGRVAAVVHHGGAGTVHAGVRAGVPTVTCPFFSDQPFWGERLHRLGAGTRPLPVHDLTPAALGDAIARAVRDPLLRARSAELGARLRAEDGVGMAVKVIEAWLDRARL